MIGGGAPRREEVGPLLFQPAVMIAEEPESPACRGMLVSYERLNPFVVSSWRDFSLQQPKKWLQMAFEGEGDDVKGEESRREGGEGRETAPVGQGKAGHCWQTAFDGGEWGEADHQKPDSSVVSLCIHSVRKVGQRFEMGPVVERVRLEGNHAGLGGRRQHDLEKSVH